MTLRHLQFLYVTKDLPEPTLAAMLRSEFFENNQARQHWARVRQNWAADVYGEQEAKFVAVAERVWRSYSDGM